MTLSTQSYKGARDFYPEDKRLQKYIFSKMREVCEQFGYEEYDAPILEPTELFLAKGNQEIIDEQTYTFDDRGQRSVTVRTEMTPSVSRMVAGRRQELAYPVRWYSIPELWRYERMQRGRLRQFWQLNVDIFGIDGVEAEHELIVLADAILKGYGAKPNMYNFRVSSRALTNLYFTTYLELNSTQQEMMIRLIDRMHKMEVPSFLAQADAILSPSQREAGILNKLQTYLAARKLNDLPADCLREPAVLRLIQLSDLLNASGITNVDFDPTLMRGFDYYTDIVFEVFDENAENNRSMFGGGRYDGLVGLFGVEPVPTAGFGMGDVTLQNFLEVHDLLPKLMPETDVYVVLIGETTYEASLPVVGKLRSMGIRAAVDATGRKIEKRLKTAAKKGILHILFIGETELASEQYRLKNLVSGDEESHGIDRIVSILADHRRKLKASPIENTAVSDDELLFT